MILRKTQGSKLTVNNEKKSINLDSRNPISFSFLNTKGIMIILQKHINPKPVSSKYLEHGKKFKPIALMGYEKFMSEFPLTHTCAYMTHKNIKGRTFFRAHASQGPTKTGYYPDIFATVLENPHVLHRSAILFTRSCLHRKRCLTFFSLQQRNQVKLHLQDRKESLMKILRRFRDPRNVFFLPNGLKNLHG